MESLADLSVNAGFDFAGPLYQRLSVLSIPAHQMPSSALIGTMTMLLNYDPCPWHPEAQRLFNVAIANVEDEVADTDKDAPGEAAEQKAE